MKTLAIAFLLFLCSALPQSSTLSADLGHFVSTSKLSSKNADNKSINVGILGERSDGQIRLSFQIEKITDRVTKKNEHLAGLVWVHHGLALGEGRQSALVTKIGPGCNSRISGRDHYLHTNPAVCRGMLGPGLWLEL